MQQNNTNILQKKRKKENTDRENVLQITQARLELTLEYVHYLPGRVFNALIGFKQVYWAPYS